MYSGSCVVNLFKHVMIGAIQERNEVRWRPRQEQVWRLILEPEVFRKEMYCDEESTCDIIGTFRRSLQSFGDP